METNRRGFVSILLGSVFAPVVMAEPAITKIQQSGISGQFGRKRGDVPGIIQCDEFGVPYGTARKVLLKDDLYVQLYAIPAKPLTAEQEQQLRDRYDRAWERTARNTMVGAHGDRTLADLINTIKVHRENYPA